MAAAVLKHSVLRGWHTEAMREQAYQAHVFASASRRQAEEMRSQNVRMQDMSKHRRQNAQRIMCSLADRAEQVPMHFLFLRWHETAQAFIHERRMDTASYNLRENADRFYRRHKADILLLMTHRTSMAAG